MFSSQVKQVFYSQEPKEAGWFVVIHNRQRNVFEMEDDVTKNEPRAECFPSTNDGFLSRSNDGHEDDDEDIYV